MTGFVDTAQQTRRRRRTRRWLIALGVVIALLVGADFAARAVAEQVAATQFQKQGNLSSKPDVTIEGFPFLTQVASKDINDVKVGISNLREGPVTFSSINATATGIKLKSYAFSSGTIAHINGTALISFASLGNTLSSEFGPLGQLLNGAGLQLRQASPDEVKASLDLIVTTGSATWRITRVSGHQLNVRLVASSGLDPSLLSGIQDKTFSIPALPLGLTLDSLSVTPSGIIGTISGNNVPFGS
jgi:LmeA-like phospholipid-binding